MTYVDGFILSVPKKNVAAYRRMAQLGCKIWMAHGALDYKECMADDMKPQGVVLSFPKLVKPKAGEVIMFSFIVYKSRKHRDQVNAKVMKDPRMGKVPKKMPFDFKRMSYGGFTTMVEKK